MGNLADGEFPYNDCVKLALVAVATIALAEVRPVPPPGIAVPAEIAAEMRADLAKWQGKADPDAAVIAKAVRWALDYNEFFSPESIERTRSLLKMTAPPKNGLVVHAYRSRIDDSLQPYGLVLPENYSPSRKWRLDAWFHGRAETLSEANFIWDRLNNVGQFAPKDTIVLHLYGRYCNANKFAGEVDLFEAIEDVKKRYSIDEDRILMRGFSMGGAAAWHIGAHFGGLWAAVAPGAGFAETPEFLKMTPQQIDATPAWERTLWHLYNATDYAANFANVPLVAYSGEIDGQKQAADIMAKALAAEGMTMTHIIGPQTPHRYHPDSKVEIDRLLDGYAAKGREALPAKVQFVTYTLKYNRMKWVTLDAMTKHWERSRIDAELRDGVIEAKTENVDGLSFEGVKATSVVLDGQKLPAKQLSFHRSGGKWAAGQKLHGKRHDLQGPIDDAFMGRFIVVKPSRTPSAWAQAEMERAIREWRRQFRGDAIVKRDSELTAADIASANIVLWGDPSSNSVMKRIASKLPVAWPKEKNRELILIAPNPENPARYVVLNSGFTFREFDYLNNARQVPKLPDWAVVDTTVAADEKAPGRIVEAGFFDEQWKRADRR